MARVGITGHLKTLEFTPIDKYFTLFTNIVTLGYTFPLETWKITYFDPRQFTKYTDILSSTVTKSFF